MGEGSGIFVADRVNEGGLFSFLSVTLSPMLKVELSAIMEKFSGV